MYLDFVHSVRVTLLRHQLHDQTKSKTASWLMYTRKTGQEHTVWKKIELALSSSAQYVLVSLVLLNDTKLRLGHLSWCCSPGHNTDDDSGDHHTGSRSCF